MAGARADDGGIIADAEQELGVGRLCGGEMAADEVEFAEGLCGGLGHGGMDWG
jgi:hypothetical protein